MERDDDDQPRTPTDLVDDVVEYPDDVVDGLDDADDALSPREYEDQPQEQYPLDGGDEEVGDMDEEHDVLELNVEPEEIEPEFDEFDDDDHDRIAVAAADDDDDIDVDVDADADGEDDGEYDLVWEDADVALDPLPLFALASDRYWTGLLLLKFGVKLVDTVDPDGDDSAGSPRGMVSDDGPVSDMNRLVEFSCRFPAQVASAQV